MDMSAVRACRILTYGNRTQLLPANKLLNKYRLTNKGKFQKWEKKKKQVLLPCIEFPGFKKITLESGIKSESLKREAAEQQLLHISHERQRQSQGHQQVPQGYKWC